ncbi:hypothetical protein UlMin_035530 [Ulmus minor]
MGLASALNVPPMAFQCSPLPRNKVLFFGHSHRRPPLPIPPPRLSSTLLSARRRNHNHSITSSSKKKNEPRLRKREAGEDDDEEVIDEDAFEALFSQLEEDLKKDDPSFEGDDGEEISEEDLAKLEKELARAFGEIDIVEDMDGEDEDGDNAEEDEDEDEEEEEEPVKLKTWQLRRLASALRTGRRKTSIKTLAAELCLDRAIVLELLRDPPPSLLMMSVALPDEKPAQVISVTETRTIEAVAETITEMESESVSEEEPDTNVKVPVHVKQQRFSSQKRIKKAHVETLESIYRRSKRPTNAMISSIVQVTNLPRKRIVKWFEDRRAGEGVPNQRLPYQRSVPNSFE